MQTEPERNNRDHYLSAWKKVFHVFLGWSEADALKWAEWCDEFLEPDDNAMFYHEPPMYYVALGLVPKRLTMSLEGMELTRFGWRIQDLIEDGDEFCSCKPDFDWQAAKIRVEKLLNEYGESLENIEPP